VPHGAIPSNAIQSNEQISPLPTLRIKLLRLLHVSCSVALILCIVGGVRQSNPNSDPKAVSSGKTLAKVGVIIFLVSFIQVVALALLTLPQAKKVHVAQKRLLYAVLLALPLITVRLIYVILANFSTSTTFSISRGDPYVQLGMAIIEEMIVVMLYTAAGFAALGTTYQAVATNQELEFDNNMYRQGHNIDSHGKTAYAGSGA
jgi:hypothetical protein